MASLIFYLKFKDTDRLRNWNIYLRLMQRNFLCLESLDFCFFVMFGAKVASFRIVSN